MHGTDGSQDEVNKALREDYRELNLRISLLLHPSITILSIQVCVTVPSTLSSQCDSGAV